MFDKERSVDHALAQRAPVHGAAVKLAELRVLAEHPTGGHRRSVVRLPDHHSAVRKWTTGMGSPGRRADTRIECGFCLSGRWTWRATVLMAVTFAVVEVRATL